MENLELGQLQVLFFVLIAFVFVILVALSIYVVAANRRERAKLEQTYEEAIEEAKLSPRPALQVTGQILALVRDEAGSPLQVEVGKTKYSKLADVEDPQIRRQIVAAAMELIQFTGVLGQGVTATPGTPGTPGTPDVDNTETWREDLRDDSQAELQHIRAAPEKGTPEPPVPAAPQDIEKQFLGLLTEMGQTVPPVEKPTLVSSIQHRLTPKLPESGQPRTFVDDIEDIVQRRVQLIPALVGRDLHVRQSPGGAVRFSFDGQEYASIDGVPNLTARQLIKDAIQEWDEIT